MPVHTDAVVRKRGTGFHAVELVHVDAHEVGRLSRGATTAGCRAAAAFNIASSPLRFQAR
jgi:hypothetical protein